MVGTFRKHWSTSLPSLAVAALALGAATTAQSATTFTTSTISEIKDFQIANSASVQTFDAISGVTAVAISNYDPVELIGTTGFTTKDPSQPVFYNSGGASFNDPNGNPGVPVAILTPSGGIANDKVTGNVAGPIQPDPFSPPFTSLLGLGPAAVFVEAIFPTPVSMVGIYVAHGTVDLILKDVNNSNLGGTFKITGTAGQFIAIDRGTAEVGGITIVGTAGFTIDEFTYGTGKSTTPPPTSNVPEAGSMLNVALAGAFLLLTHRKLKRAS